MSWLRSLLATASGLVGALKYELVRLGNFRSLRGAAFFAFLGSAILTLPAARHMVGLAHPVPPGPPVPTPSLSLLSLASSASVPSASGWSTALLHQYSPMHGGGGWVVNGGVVGMVLPGAVAACIAAWLGATSIGYEYRYGGGLLTFALLPRRVSVLVAKAVVAAFVGALLCLGATVVSYWTARLGFKVSGVEVALPSQLMLAGWRPLALAALCGALGVVGGAVLRLRLLATAVALAGGALIAVFLPRSTSLAMPYVAEAAQRAVRLTPGITDTAALGLLLALPLSVLMLSGVLAVRRRRVV
ncbi:hypothetical protein [Actinocrinis sp.]|uniref:hypothetical protein n=1 Tax=Actinocrinis sp. TaxID=1920516 RepID=UPI002D317D5A|nr:hypothetical protein [Actinocrinis sp.]HZP54222.1 hypothetical protein [Actinocrinis sp.]